MLLQTRGALRPGDLVQTNNSRPGRVRVDGTGGCIGTIPTGTRDA
jgi:hypothetical protein